MMQTLRTRNDDPVVQHCFDSEEFSLHHWVRVWKLVDEADIAVEEGPAWLAGSESVPKKKVASEVQATTAYQHFARDVV